MVMTNARHPSPMPQSAVPFTSFQLLGRSRLSGQQAAGSGRRAQGRFSAPDFRWVGLSDSAPKGEQRMLLLSFTIHARFHESFCISIMDNDDEASARQQQPYRRRSDGTAP